MSRRLLLSTRPGEFVFSAVNPATYSVIVEAPGFKKLGRRGVRVNTQEFVTVDLHLEIGQVSDAVK